MTEENKRRQDRAQEYITRVRKERTRKMTWRVLWAEVVLALVAALLIAALKGGVSV